MNSLILNCFYLFFYFIKQNLVNIYIYLSLQAKKKKKRSLIGEYYYEEFSTEFQKEPETASSNVPNRRQLSRIPRPISSSSTAPGSRTTSKIPRAISSPNRSRPTTPSLSRPPSSGSRPVTPSFSQSAETINIFINYNKPD